MFFFSIWVFFLDHSWITWLQGKGEGISLTPHYHFHLLHRHLDISRVITAESSLLPIGSSQAQTRNLWFPSASWVQVSALFRFNPLHIVHLKCIVNSISKTSNRVIIMFVWWICCSLIYLSSSMQIEQLKLVQ